MAPGSRSSFAHVSSTCWRAYFLKTLRVLKQMKTTISTSSSNITMAYWKWSKKAGGIRVFVLSTKTRRATYRPKGSWGFAQGRKTSEHRNQKDDYTKAYRTYGVVARHCIPTQSTKHYQQHSIDLEGLIYITHILFGRGAIRLWPLGTCKMHKRKTHKPINSQYSFL